MENDNGKANQQNSRGPPNTLDLCAGQNMTSGSSQVCDTGPALVVSHCGRQLDHGVLSQPAGTSFVGEKSNAVLNAVNSDQRLFDFSERNLPLPTSSGSIDFTDANFDDILKALRSSNDPLMLSLDTDIPPSKRFLTDCFMQVPEDMQHNFNEQSFPSSIGGSGSSPTGRQCPTGGAGGRNGNGTTSSSQAQSGNSGTASQFVSGHSFGRSSVGAFSGGGGGCGDDDDPFQSRRPMELIPSHYDDDLESLMEIEAAPASAEANEQGPEAGVRNGPLVTASNDLFAGGESDFRLFDQELLLETDFSAMVSDNPLSLYDTAIGGAVAQVPVQVMPSPTKTTDVNQDCFACISLMNQGAAKLPVLKGPAASVTTSETVYPRSPFTPSSPHLSPPSPLTSYQPPTPLSAYAASPTPSSSSSLPTPSTPPPSTPTQRSGLFEICTHISGKTRYFEMSAPASDNKALQALFQSYQLCEEFYKCAGDVCDLKVANAIKAKLCDFKFENELSKLVFTLPSSCKPLSEWLEENKSSDLVVRHIILQQIVNAMATVHTVGSADHLNFCGSLMVWVDPELHVYLLIDFPTLFEKMAVVMATNQDPRLEDVVLVSKLFKELIQPHINRDATWVSPGMRSVLAEFQRLLQDRSSGYRMAELARILGGQRLCRVEVNYNMLAFFVYCIEHEPLAQALSVLEQLVFNPVSAAHWVSSGREVGSGDLATAGKPLKISLVPVDSRPASSHGLIIYSPV